MTTADARQTDPGPELAAIEGGSAAPRRNRLNLASLAYDRLEELIVTCTLRPGLSLSIQDLQAAVGLGRTPIHQAVSRMAAETLIAVHPRHGLRIAPIDLSRERTLLQLRRDMERFVVRHASARSSGLHRNQLLHALRTLREQGGSMDIRAFNQLDRRIDRLLILAAGEPFLERTLGPLHTIFRRIGWIYHRHVAPGESLVRTTACHVAILEAVVAGRADAATAASDALIDFSGSMFDVLELGVDPALLDCTHTLLAAG